MVRGFTVEGKVRVELTDRATGEIVETRETSNMCFDRLLDRICACMTQSNSRFYGHGLTEAPDWNEPGFGPGFDSIEYGNTLGFFNHKWKIQNPSPLVRYYNYSPTLIGLGKSTVENTRNLRGLIDPFNHACNNYNYRNTLTSKEGHNNYNERKFDTLRIAANWDTWDSDGEEIAEVGLFWHEWMPIIFDFNNDGNVDECNFNLYEDKYWRVVNLTYMEEKGSPVDHYDFATAIQNDTPSQNNILFSYSFDRTTQILTWTGDEPSPGNNVNGCIAYAEPRYDSKICEGYGSGFGHGPVMSKQTFQAPHAHDDLDVLPQMAARATFDNPFEKSNDQLMSVVWLLYFRRAEEFT